MILDRVEAITSREFPNVLFVRVWADGASGLGDTFFSSEAGAPIVGEHAARLGGVDLEWSDRLDDLLGLPDSGTVLERRAASAINIALADLAAKRDGVPLHRLLGSGPVRTLPIYNTCAGPSYLKDGPDVESGNWGRRGDGAGPDDLEAFLTDPVGLARSLLDDGVSAMKIWPFDPYAEASNGQWISAAELDEGMRPFRLVREALGDEMALLAELHGLWSLPMAERISTALLEVEPRWIEDPIRPDNAPAWVRLRDSVGGTFAGGETLGGERDVREFLAAGAATTTIIDVGWVGGLRVAADLAAFARDHDRSMAFHNCGGPASFATSVALASTFDNVRVQETIRGFERGWFGRLATDWPRARDGAVSPLDRPGHGVELRDEFVGSPSTVIRSWTRGSAR